MITLLFISAIFFITENEAQAYVDPSGDPPPFNTVPGPINVSSSIQQKAGTLIIGDENQGLFRFNVDNGINPCLAANEGEMYYSSGNLNYCSTNDWATFRKGSTGIYLEYGNLTQEGYVEMQARAGDTFAILGSSTLWSFAPGEWTAGIRGDSGDGALGPSYGIYGLATVDNAETIAVYGTNFASPNSYAGYFKGNVKIESNSPNTKLEVGTAADPMELCLNDDGTTSECKTSWPGGTSSLYWVLNEPEDLIYASPTNYDVTIGGYPGGSQEAEYYFSIDQEAVVIGDPAGFALSMTCGDGACINETNLICTQDCPPTIININVTNFRDDKVDITWDVLDDFIMESYVNYGPDANYGSQSPAIPPSGTGSFQAELSGLSAGEYHYQIVAKDAYGNWTYAPDNTFTVLCGNGTCDGGEDNLICSVDCPPVLTNIFVTDRENQAASVFWTVDEDITSGYVNYGLTSAYGSQSGVVSGPAGTYINNLAGLLRDTLYHYQVVAEDLYGNVTSSPDETFMTLDCGDAICDAQETCANCAVDCVNTQGGPACPNSMDWCLASGVCKECRGDQDCRSFEACCNGECKDQCEIPIEN